MMQVSDKNSLGKKLYDLRKYKNLSLDELADLTGISRSNLNRYERGLSKPTSEYLKILCQFYKVTPDWLLFDTQPGELERSGWMNCDPELRAMAERLEKLMHNGDPHLRSWAIVQFANAFKERV